MTYRLTHHPIGIPEVDQQHDGLAEAIKQIEADLKAGVPQERIAAGLNRLLHLSRIHFATEEEHMLSHAYPAFSDHRAEHTSLAAQLEDICRAAAESTDPNLGAKLWQWFTAHAERADRAYGRWFL
jgi:hemerythrin